MALVVFTPAAETDIADAVKWYERRATAVGVRFIAELDEAVGRVAANPMQYPVVYKNVRRALLRRFPYALFFRIREDVIQVLGCFHTSRSPRRWQVRT